MKKYIEYYKNLNVLYKLQRYTYQREFAILMPKNQSSKANTRYLKAHSVQHLQYLLKELKITDGKMFNLYTSVAKYKNGITNQSMNLSKRDNTDWKKNHWKEISSYDFFMDIDSDGDLEIAKYQTQLIIDALNSAECPFYLRFSGDGFHILIPDFAFPIRLSYDPYGKDTVYHKYRELCLKIQKKYAPLIDDTIYDSKRLIKLPYSIAVYNGYERVCMPLDNANLREFDIERCNMGEVLYNRNKERLFNPIGEADTFIERMGVQW